MSTVTLPPTAEAVIAEYEAWELRESGEVPQLDSTEWRDLDEAWREFIAQGGFCGSDHAYRCTQGTRDYLAVLRLISGGASIREAFERVRRSHVRVTPEAEAFHAANQEVNRINREICTIDEIMSANVAWSQTLEAFQMTDPELYAAARREVSIIGSWDDAVHAAAAILTKSAAAAAAEVTS